LGALREVKDARKAERDLIAREDSLSSDLLGGATRSTASMQKQVAALRTMADVSTDSPERRMARRVLAGASMSAREGVRGLIDNGDYRTAAGLLEMAIAIRPAQTRSYFELARVRALDGDRTLALAALQQATERGFADAQRADEEKAFSALKSDPSWPALLAKIRANPPEPDRQSPERP
jgi:hypothetical protein